MGLIEDNALKEAVESALKAEQIGFGNIYPGAMSDQECSQRYMRAHVGGNQAQKICRSVINLPVFPYITIEELSSVVEVVRSVCEEQ